ncbi:hypothetical protein X734_23505 [Mesorhizobium sp. L2C084A000]|nr:hypothetical protein X734_23505 [Mesorhizobium sp. L2C084A000]
MAGATTVDMVVAADKAGALGSLPSPQVNVEGLRQALTEIRTATTAAVNVNFSRR